MGEQGTRGIAGGQPAGPTATAADPPVVPATDIDDFESFFRRERDRVVRLLWAMTGSHAVAEDLAQETFAAAHRRWARVRDLERPDLWLRRVALNRAIGVARRRTTEQKALARLARYGTPQLAAVDPEPHVPEPPVLAAIRDLPRRQRQVVGLVYLDDRSIDDAALALGLTPSTVRTHLERARAALASALAANDETEQRR